MQMRAYVYTKPHHHIEMLSRPIDNRMAIIKKTKVDRCWGGRENVCALWRCKLVQLLRKLYGISQKQGNQQTLWILPLNTLSMSQAPCSCWLSGHHVPLALLVACADGVCSVFHTIRSTSFSRATLQRLNL